MPLVFAPINEQQKIRKVSGQSELKRHLENLGFVPGGYVTVIYKSHNNVIVNVKESRIALSEELARKIIVESEGEK